MSARDFAFTLIGMNLGIAVTFVLIGLRFGWRRAWQLFETILRWMEEP